MGLDLDSGKVRKALILCTAIYVVWNLFAFIYLEEIIAVSELTSKTAITYIGILNSLLPIGYILVVWFNSNIQGKSRAFWTLGLLVAPIIAIPMFLFSEVIWGASKSGSNVAL
jgi:hypothetical protein